MNRLFRLVLVLLTVAATLLPGNLTFAQDSAAERPPAFPPLEQWKSAILAGDAAGLKTFYSNDPPAQVMANGVKTSAVADENFWLGLKALSINLEMVRNAERHGGRSIVFKAEVQLPDGRTLHVTDGQGWREQGGQWRLTGVERADDPHLTQPSDMNANIYPANADAHADIKAAEERAAAGHKRVLLIFGANWCYDCHVLDLAFHRPDFAQVMASYEVVHVDLGPDEEKNSDIVKQFNVPLDKGIPVVAIAESDGRLVVSQKNGEFEDARSLTPQALLEFLNQWKPGNAQ